MKKIKKLLSVCLAFLLMLCTSVSFSACKIEELIVSIANDMVERRAQIKQKREDRIYAIPTEVDYDYAVFDNSFLHVVIDGKRTEYRYQDLVKEVLKTELGLEEPVWFIVYDVVGGSKKMYFCARYDQHSTEYDSGDVSVFIETFDVAVLSMEYETGKCELVYDFKNLAPTASRRFSYKGDHPKCFTLVDDDYGIIYENGEIKVLNLNTKEITYSHLVYENPRNYSDFSEGSPYGDGEKYVDYIAQRKYYEYRDGTFVEHTFAFASMQVGDVGPFKTNYYNAQQNCIYRVGNFVCSDKERRAFDLTSGEAVDYAEVTKGITQNGLCEITESGKELVPFFVDGEKYYRDKYGPYGIYTPSGEVLFRVNQSSFDESGNTAYQQLKRFYNEDEEFEPKRFSGRFFNEKYFIFSSYERAHLGWSEVWQSFVYEYDIKTQTLKYLGYFELHERNDETEGIVVL